MFKSYTFIEGIEGQFLNERYPVHLDVVALGIKFHDLHFLATDDGPHIWF